MIEPQNTMMPLAAEPAPVDLPQGEEGFGAMLAQTLGMVPQLDPNAVQQIAGRQGDGEQEAADLTGGSNPQPSEDRQPTRLGRHITIPTAGKVDVVATPSVERPPIIDGRFVDPVYAKGESPAPTAPPAAPVVQEPDTLPQPPVATEVPVADATGEPVVAAEAPLVAAGSLPKPPQPVADPLDAAPAPTKTPVVAAPPEVDPSGDFEPVDPVVQPRPEPPPAAPVKPPATADPVVAPVRTAPAEPVAAEPAQPVRVDRAPVAKPDRGIPVNPLPTADRPVEATATASAPPVAPSMGVARRDAAPESTPNVQMTERPMQVAADSAVPLRESTVRVEGARPTPQSQPHQVVVAGSSPQPNAPATPVTTPAAPIQHSALAERVMQAVEMQANQPPPRTMVVDIPEIEGLRLVVSVRGGAEVHVVPASASTATAGVQPFLEELQGVLENRGFVMTGDDRRRNGQRQDQDEPAPARRSRPTFRRAERTDNDLRI
ncbi:MAG: hypothetical protein QNJ89_02575 [Acidimicrobiia bacterium]|nr:hypothetical protein [Acidimicrobiia bacterium]